MARDFTKNTANYLSLGTEQLVALVSGASALSIAAWVNFDTIGNVTNDNRVLAVSIDAGKAGFLIATGASGANNLPRIGGRSQSADTFQATNGTSNFPTG